MLHISVLTSDLGTTVQIKRIGHRGWYDKASKASLNRLRVWVTNAVYAGEAICVPASLLSGYHVHPKPK